MNSFGSQTQRQDSLIRRSRQQLDRRSLSFPNYRCVGSGGVALAPSSSSMEDDAHLLLASVVPPVTVVLEGRSICHRINLHKLGSYRSLARALRQMFVDGNDDNDGNILISEKDLDLTNAIPGHIIAYEDIENDLLLAGDLNWKDFVRVAKRIRILPVKGNARRGKADA